MRRLANPYSLVLLLLLLVSACGSGGNGNLANKEKGYHGSPPPRISNPAYDPYAASNETWVAPTYDRNGSIIKPPDPATMRSIENYPGADWVGGNQGPKYPAGTF